MQNKKVSTKSMLEAGLMAAILVIEMLIVIYVPVIDIICIFVIPLPITLAYVRNGFKYALAALIVGSIIGIVLVSPILGLPLAVEAGGAGLTLGYCISHNKKAVTSFIYVAIAFLATSAITIAMTTMFTDIKGITGIVDTVISTYTSSVDSAKQLYLSMGVDKNQVEQVFSQTNTITKDMMMYIFPAAMIFSSILLSYFYYKLTSSVFRRLKIKINELRRFEYFYIPNMLAAAMIAATCLGLILQNKKILVGNYIFGSVFGLLQLALFIQGIAVVLYFLKNKLNNSKAAVVIIVLTVLILKDIYVYIGIAELIFDFRKLDPTRIKSIR